MLRTGRRNAIIGGFRSWERTQSGQERDFLLLKTRGKRKGRLFFVYPFLYNYQISILYLSLKSQSKRIFENQVFIFYIMLTRQEIFRGCTAGFASLLCFSIIENKSQKGNPTGKGREICNASEKREKWVGMDTDCIDQQFASLRFT